MNIILRDIAAVLTLILLLLPDICPARPLRKLSTATPTYEQFLNEQCVTQFLNEQCVTVEGRENLASLLKTSTGFCENDDVTQKCDWCAVGKILHDCTRNIHYLEKLVHQYLDMDRNGKISHHESMTLPRRIHRPRHRHAYYSNVILGRQRNLWPGFFNLRGFSGK